jgi:hypothetical protein
MTKRKSTFFPLGKVMSQVSILSPAYSGPDLEPPRSGSRWRSGGVDHGVRLVDCAGPFSQRMPITILGGVSRPPGAMPDRCRKPGRMVLGDGVPVERSRRV